MENPIPVVDLDAENASELIGEACKNWGIFQVVNHNIKQSLLDEMKEAVKDLFSLPMEQKLMAAAPHAGGLGYGVPAIYSSFSKLPWSEGFHIAGSPLEHARKLWPTDYKTFCDVVEEYEKEMKILALRMTWLMSGSLGISKDDVEWSGPKGDFEGGYTAIQLNAYPPCPDPNRAMGLVAHTDSSIVTILHQNTNGLEVHKEGFGWVPIPLIPGSLTVNVGDLFHILSNGIYKTACHRAVVNRTTYRVSMAFFFGPKPTVKISPLPKLIDHSHPQLYSPVTWSEFRAFKLEDHNDTFSKIRICTPENESGGANDNPKSVKDQIHHGKI